MNSSTTGRAKFISVTFIGFLLLGCNSFSAKPSLVLKHQVKIEHKPLTGLYAQNDIDSKENYLSKAQRNVSHLLSSELKKITQDVVAVVLSLSVVTSLPFNTNNYAHAIDETSTVQPPKTALVIETTQKQAADESFLKAKIDGKALVKSLIKNRKELNASFGRIIEYSASEIKSSPWLEVGREVLDIEGDVIPSVKVSLPVDWQGAIKDISLGKLDVVVNGEILYIDIQEVKGEKPGDDEITIRIKGTRASLPNIAKEAEIEKIDPGSKLWDFLDAPFPLGQKFLPSGYTATNGQTIFAGTSVGVAASYIISYQIYRDEISQLENKEKAKKARSNSTTSKPEDVVSDKNGSLEVDKFKKQVKSKPEENGKESQALNNEENQVILNAEETKNKAIRPTEDPFGEAAQIVETRLTEDDDKQDGVLPDSEKRTEVGSNQLSPSINAVGPIGNEAGKKRKRSFIRRLFRREE